MPHKDCDTTVNSCTLNELDNVEMDKFLETFKLLGLHHKKKMNRII